MTAVSEGYRYYWASLMSEEELSLNKSATEQKEMLEDEMPASEQAD